MGAGFLNWQALVELNWFVTVVIIGKNHIFLAHIRATEQFGVHSKAQNVWTKPKEAMYSGKSKERENGFKVLKQINLHRIPAVQ